MKKMFSRDHMFDVLDSDRIVSDEIIDHARWSVRHKLIWREPGQSDDEAWKTTYSVGATESQDEGPTCAINSAPPSPRSRRSPRRACMSGTHGCHCSLCTLERGPRESDR
jgi:hypothetical protein